MLSRLSADTSKDLCRPDTCEDMIKAHQQGCQKDLEAGPTVHYKAGWDCMHCTTGIGYAAW